MLTSVLQILARTAGVAEIRVMVSSASVLLDTWGLTVKQVHFTRFLRNVILAVTFFFIRLCLYDVGVSILLALVVVFARFSLSCLTVR